MKVNERNRKPNVDVNVNAFCDELRIQSEVGQARPRIAVHRRADRVMWPMGHACSNKPCSVQNCLWCQWSPSVADDWPGEKVKRQDHTQLPSRPASASELCHKPQLLMTCGPGQWPVSELEHSRRRALIQFPYFFIRQLIMYSTLLAHPKRIHFIACLPARVSTSFRSLPVKWNRLAQFRRAHSTNRSICCASLAW